MKNNSANKIKLGVFVFVSIALFIAGIYFIGNRQQLFNSTFEISGIFQDVNGLKAGNNIRLAGINVGTIESIEILSDTSVRVNMTISEDTRKFIKKNAIGLIGSEGLMGNKVISIIPGTSGSKLIENNDMIKTAIPPGMDDIMLKVNTTADNAIIISDQLAEILIKVNSGEGTIGRLLQDTTIAENINQTIINLKRSSKGLDENMEAAKHNILLKGYFKGKKKDAERKEKEEAEKIKEENP
jgi:phospholipid/cholesterol/gamma-HCH transport system substrate-binding protein